MGKNIKEDSVLFPAKYLNPHTKPLHIITKCGWEKGKVFICVEDVSKASMGTTMKQLILGVDDILAIIEAKQGGHYQLPQEGPSHE